MLQAMQSCRRAGAVRSWSTGMGFGEPQRIGIRAGEGVGTGASHGVSQVGGHPGWKLCPGSGAGREGWTLGSVFVLAVHALRKRMAESRGRVSQSHARHEHIKLLPGTGAPLRHWLFIKTTYERSKEVTA